MMTKRQRYLIAAIASGMAMIVSGCDRPEGQADKFGQKLESPMADATKQIDRATTGTTDGATAGAMVAEKAAGAVDDAAVTTKVKAALIAEPGLATMPIDVDTRNGVVTLLGNVDSAEHGTRAIEVARATSGVRGVVDKLVVKPS